MGAETRESEVSRPRDGGKVFNVVNDWYLTTPDGVTHGPYSKPQEAIAVLKLMCDSRAGQTEKGTHTAA